MISKATLNIPWQRLTLNIYRPSGTFCFFSHHIIYKNIHLVDLEKKNLPKQKSYLERGERRRTHKGTHDTVVFKSLTNIALLKRRLTFTYKLGYYIQFLNKTLQCHSHRNNRHNLIFPVFRCKRPKNRTKMLSFLIESYL